MITFTIGGLKRLFVEIFKLDSDISYFFRNKKEFRRKSYKKWAAMEMFDYVLSHGYFDKGCITLRNLKEAAGEFQGMQHEIMERINNDNPCYEPCLIAEDVGFEFLDFLQTI